MLPSFHVMSGRSRSSDRVTCCNGIASNDVEVVVLYHQRGVDPSGRACDTEVIGLYRVEGNKVTRVQMFYFDPEHIASFLTAAHRPATP